MSLIALATLVVSLESPIGFDRVDIVSEDTGTWLNYELPMATVTPATSVVRFVEQVKPVWTTPVPGLTIGTSNASQSVGYERALLERYGLSWSVGLHTKLLLPRGVFAGVAWRWWRLRVAVGASLTSSASWARLDWTNWTLVPTLGLGIGRAL